MKQKMQAVFSFEGDAERVLEAMERAGLQRDSALNFIQNVVLTIRVRYPSGGGAQQYALPAARGGDTTDACRALRQLEAQARIDPDQAQEVRLVLEKFASYMR